MGECERSGTATLILASAQVEDAGTYSVVLTNAYGSVTSSPATLTVVTNVFGRSPLPKYQRSPAMRLTRRGPLRPTVCGGWRFWFAWVPL